MKILPLSYLRWSLYRLYLWMELLPKCDALANTILLVFDAFEDADLCDAPILVTLQTILIEIRDDVPRDRLSTLWLRWMAKQSAHWRIVDEPAVTPYVHFKRISRSLGHLAVAAQLTRSEDMITFRYAAHLLRYIPSSDHWLYGRIQHELLRTHDAFWSDLRDVLFPLPPASPLLERADVRETLEQLLRGEEVEDEEVPPTPLHPVLAFSRNPGA